MKNSKTLNIDFYRNLGKLFFAIAAADKTVNEQEFETLKTIVKTHWLDVDSVEDSYGTDTAYQIEIVFDWLNNDEELNAKVCFYDFIAFKNKHESLFTKEIKALIMKSASAIASSFSGVNKSELIILAKLNMELNNNSKL